MKKLLAAAVAAAMTMTATFAMADGAIKIGEIGPLTGAAAIYGTAVANGAQIAIDELNALGGQQYELNAQDDEADAEKSVNAYNNLLDWGAQMMLATVTTNPCIAVGAQAHEDRRPPLLRMLPPIRTTCIRSASPTRRRAPLPRSTSPSTSWPRRSP